MKYRSKKKTVVASLRIPEPEYSEIMRRMEAEDLDFSKFVRRAVRRELVLAGYPAAEVPVR